MGSLLYRLHLTEYDGFPTIMGFLLGFLLALTVLVSVVVVAVYGVERQTCYSQLHDMKRDGDYGWWTGCMVELRDGSRVPIENFREFSTDYER